MGGAERSLDPEVSLPRVVEYRDALDHVSRYRGSRTLARAEALWRSGPGLPRDLTNDLRRSEPKPEISPILANSIWWRCWRKELRKPAQSPAIEKPVSTFFHPRHASRDAWSDDEIAGLACSIRSRNHRGTSGARCCLGHRRRGEVLNGESSAGRLHAPSPNTSSTWL